MCNITINNGGGEPRAPEGEGGMGGLGKMLGKLKGGGGGGGGNPMSMLGGLMNMMKGG